VHQRGGTGRQPGQRVDIGVIGRYHLDPGIGERRACRAAGDHPYDSIGVLQHVGDQVPAVEAGAADHDDPRCVHRRRT
jgi:hypothetical protein